MKIIKGGSRMKRLPVWLLVVIFAAIGCKAEVHENKKFERLHAETVGVPDNGMYEAAISGKGFSKESRVLVSWNACNFGKKKTNEAIVFMAKFLKDADIVALQEVSTSDAGAQAVARLSDELNRSGAKWDYAVSDPTHESKEKERFAFLWKTSRADLRPRKAILFDMFKDEMVREPASARFMIGGKQLIVVNFHLAPTKKHPEDEVEVLAGHSLEFMDGEYAFVGDFNLGHEDLDSAFEGRLGFKHNIEGKTSLKLKPKKGGPYVFKEYDNIYTSRGISVQKAAIADFVPNFKVYDEAHGISDHLPVFIVFEMK